MAQKVIPYSQEIEKDMAEYASQLNEKNKRRYAAVEVKKLGYGGYAYICELLDISFLTVKKGEKELKAGEKYEGIRKPGGGRRKVLDKHSNRKKVFDKIIKPHTGGDPMNPDVKRTELSEKEISDEFKKRNIGDISPLIVKQMLTIKGFKRRKNIKKKSLSNVENRNEQFENIEEKIKKAVDDGAGIFSIDTKKKNK